MWYLTEVKPKREQLSGPKYWLGGVNGGGRTIGRKHVDIRMRASSVSRKHADIIVSAAAFYTPTANRRQRSCISVVDSSAYGTFLKYNPSDTPRHVVADGHHRRLDKDTPTDIYEGAMLAFGAPTVWWRLCWRSVVITCTRLSVDQNTRIRNITQATALELADDLDSDVTHLVVPEVLPSNIRFLTALATNRHIVTPAWVEAVHSIASRACNAIAEAATKEAAAKATELPDEATFLPSFLEGQRSVYLDDDSSSIFAEDRRKARKNLFKHIVFAFPREERRSRYVSLIEALGGKTVITAAATAADKNDSNTRYIYINDSPSSSPTSYHQNRPRGREKQAFPETAIMSAILRANLSSFVVSSEDLEAQQPLENTDVGTPGPLDVESDPESEVSDGTNPHVHNVDKVQEDGLEAVKPDFVVGNLPVEAMDVDQEANKDEEIIHNTNDVDQQEVSFHISSNPSHLGKKRVRGDTIMTGTSGQDNRGTKYENVGEEDQVLDISLTEKGSKDDIANITSENNIKSETEKTQKAEDLPGSASNVHSKDERNFFVVQPAKLSMASGSSKDVRTFCKRSLPSASKVPLKKVRYVEELPDVSVYERRLVREQRLADGCRDKKKESESEE